MLKNKNADITGFIGIIYLVQQTQQKPIMKIGLF